MVELSLETESEALIDQENMACKSKPLYTIIYLSFVGVISSSHHLYETSFKR